MQVDIIYCLVPKSYWETWEGKETYLPRDYEQEGFIHATKSEELLGKVANRVYKDFTDELYVLVIQEQKIASPVKYEQAKDGLLYPHIYGPLNKDAILEIREMKRTDGNWGVAGVVG
ncbi:DUF952 domain-containing protein [Brevibacillus borstelensis]|uniref:DUF952 domain-containing protein n=1 Tax=Brevibacillus borstelensis TaxID=45462 RepID=UPI00036D8ABA|nr:DUF952 domain-containing protein [Brevibacillus borstelensis]MCC0564085.1 DUF952 domain-containing protein [Brevibacillus borstelensis]MCM3470797.1 DUF952 domain-containing protein [Brevibacillus borstelensis]MCM3558861.1 DUF952 domain-containing protein [Brevibacillus borstelensis]MCM3592240.1 DUF952 domain-containing protein [Brevibacillus borstelensis]MCM3622901.1 DUF952 domain-containing protein [Brevibacillus borstelensis]